MQIKTAALVAVTGLALVFGATAGATAGVLVGSDMIENNSVASIDIKDRTIKPRDLSGATKRFIKSKAGKPGAAGTDGNNGANGVNGLNGEKGESIVGPEGAPGTPGEDGEDGDDAGTNEPSDGVNTNWEPNAGSEIVDDTTVRLTKAPGEGTSVEIANLNKVVQAGQTLSFTYRVAGGAAYGAGSPRIFIETNGSFFNTHDGDPSDAGVANGDGSFTKTVTIPNNGRVGQAGVVYDNPALGGTITISDVTIAGDVLNFR